VRADPALRLADYERALRFYLKLLNGSVGGILFVENSNSDVGTLRAIADEAGAGDKVEFVVFDGLDYPPSYDRGYGEFKLLDHAMEHSQLVRDSLASDPETKIWKVTGRYIVNNLSNIIKTSPKEFDFYCNCRDLPKPLTDMYLLAWNRRGHEVCIKDSYHALKITPETPPGMVPEELYRQYLDKVGGNVRTTRRLRLTPFLVGYRGGDNKQYSVENLWKYRVRNSARIVAPWLWI
jgi:hypothetical protein